MIVAVQAKVPSDEEDPAVQASIAALEAAGLRARDPQLFAQRRQERLERGDLKVISISGDRDGLATPEKIERSKANLPATARYVVLPGAAHSTFADYGPQSGDGTPTADRAASQAEVAKAAGELLASLTPKKKAK